MPTHEVVISGHHQDFIEALVKSGRYQNASEVLREGLRLVEEHERHEAAKLKALRQAVSTRWDDVAAGRYTNVSDEDLEDYCARLGV